MLPAPPRWDGFFDNLRKLKGSLDRLPLACCSNRCCNPLSKPLFTVVTDYVRQLSDGC